MARPIKEGLEYFPLDCDIDQDDKIALIEAQHGIVGFGIVIKLLMKIYKNSYYYEWTEKEQLLFSKRINVDINSINVVINDCIKWGLFDSNLLKTKKILTSKGVQVRYLEAVRRRTKVEMKKEYLLLDEDTVNAYKNLVIVNNNPSSVEVNDDIGTQSKVKKSKVKKRKENNTETINVSSGSSEDFNIFRYMQQRGFISISPIMAEQIQADIEMYSLEEVKQAIDIADNNGKHTYSYVKGILQKRRAENPESDNNIWQEMKKKIEVGEDPF